METKDLKTIPNEVLLYCYYDIVLSQYPSMFEEKDNLLTTFSKIISPNFATILKEKRAKLYNNYKIDSAKITNDEKLSVEDGLKKLVGLSKTFFKSKEDYDKLNIMHNNLLLLLDEFDYETYEKGTPIITQHSTDNKQECHSLILTKGNLIYVHNNDCPQTLYTSKDEGKINNYLHKSPNTNEAVITTLNTKTFTK